MLHNPRPPFRLVLTKKAPPPRYELEEEAQAPSLEGAMSWAAAPWGGAEREREVFSGCGRLVLSRRWGCRGDAITVGPFPGTWAAWSAAGGT